MLCSSWPITTYYIKVIVKHSSLLTIFLTGQNLFLSDIETPTIAIAMTRYGIPERFHSDRANHVQGLVIQELNKFLRISKSKL